MGIYWIIGFAAAAAVVEIVVVLLLGIIYQTNRIIKLAGVALGAVEQIEHVDGVARRDELPFGIFR